MKWKSLKTPVFSQSDYIFAMLIMQEQSLQEPSLSRSETDIRQKACLNTLWASIWDPFGKPKSLPNRSGGRLERHWISDFEVYPRWGFGEVVYIPHMYPSDTHLWGFVFTIIYIMEYTLSWYTVRGFSIETLLQALWMIGGDILRVNSWAVLTKNNNLRRSKNK